MQAFSSAVDNFDFGRAATSAAVSVGAVTLDKNMLICMQPLIQPLNKPSRERGGEEWLERNEQLVSLPRELWNDEMLKKG